jgi:hypothetical protein
MKNYTEEQLLELYDSFIQLIESKFDGERRDKLTEMYSFDELGGRLIVAPASGRDFYHNAYPGGYMEHVVNVYKASFALKVLFERMGGEVDFTDEELAFATIHHDLGKLGDDKFEYFIPETSAWHRDNLGSIFKMNPDIQFMHVPDRALYMLNHYGVDMTQAEWLGIKLSDGAYDETARSYLIQFQRDKAMKYSLPYFVHWADHFSTVLEKNVWKQDE